MSVSSTQTRADAVGNGSTQTYGFNFAVTSNSDIKVTVADLLGNESTPDFTINRNGFTVGGEITLSNGPLVLGWRIAIYRVTPVIQDSTFNVQNGAYLKTIETTFDRQTLMLQEANAKAAGAVQLPKSVSPANFNPTLPSNIQGAAGGVLVVNPTGNGFVVGPSVGDVSGAAGAAAIASGAASAAGSSASSASTSASNAAASAAAASASVSAKLDKSANLSDVADASTARANLGLGSASTMAASAFDAAGAASAAAASAQGASLQKTQNLLDLANPATARTNLGLGSMAQQAATGVVITGGTVKGVIGGGTASASNSVVLAQGTLASLTALPRLAGAVYFATDTLKEYVDTGIALIAVGSGSGSGGINDITNPDAETDTSGYTTYNNTAGISPVTGTGGTSSTTWTRETTATGWLPIRGTGSFMLSKPASNRQGDGVATPVTIDRADQGKVMQLSLDYAVATGTYDGQVSAWLYDITNAKLIYPMDGDGTLPNHLLPSAQYVQRFQTSYNSTSYRLILHVASTSTSLFALYCDNLSFGPQTITRGFSGTDLVDYTPTLTGFGTSPTIVKSKWRKVGDCIEIIGMILGGSSPSGIASVTLPTGLRTDSTKLAASPVYTVVGSVNQDNQGVTVVPIATASDSAFYFGYFNSSTSTASVPQNVVVAGHYIGFTVSIPIQGWSSNVAMSSDVSGRLSVSTAGTNTSTHTNSGNWQRVTGFTAQGDRAGNFNASTGVWTALESGPYAFMGSLGYVGAAAGRRGARLIKNTSLTTGIGYFCSNIGSAAAGPDFSYAGIIELVAGDTIELQGFQDSGGNLAYQADSDVYTRFSAFKIAGGSQQIAATDPIFAKYNTAAGQNIVSGTPNTVVFGSKIEDTHNAMNATTGVYTTPAPGRWTVIPKILFTSAAWGANTAVNATVTWPGGNEQCGRSNELSVAQTFYRIAGGQTVTTPWLPTGSAIQFVVNPQETHPLLTDATFNVITIKRES